MTNEQILTRLVLQSSPQLIVRAKEIEIGMWDIEPKTINVEVHKNKWTDTLKEEFPDKYSKIIELNVIAVDAYRIDTPYYVQYPNGEYDWVRKVN